MKSKKLVVAVAMATLMFTGVTSGSMSEESKMTNSSAITQSIDWSVFAENTAETENSGTFAPIMLADNSTYESELSTIRPVSPDPLGVYDRLRKLGRYYDSLPKGGTKDIFVPWISKDSPAISVTVNKPKFTVTRRRQ